MNPTKDCFQIEKLGIINVTSNLIRHQEHTDGPKKCNDYCPIGKWLGRPMVVGCIK